MAEGNDRDESMEYRLKYISKGHWFSKMIVDYDQNDERKHIEVEDSENSILIPKDAANIEVSFKVMRGPGVWCDVKKYDRFEKYWVKPTQPHIFKYRSPVSRTFTLAGGLYYEAVMKITNEHFDDVNEV
ncbi:uncharacterized protein LOC114538185 [Dendronephthya gigantea]|uniref:uncharacterized protein LOC114538185 n=1 Tax=Dendronephthya gigantea TaxID=151771 RepID=UPI001069E6E7|nr:uncharacterized protein LOC114538185 [Dendronephthya gigantea]